MKKKLLMIIFLVIFIGISNAYSSSGERFIYRIITGEGLWSMVEIGMTRKEVIKWIGKAQGTTTSVNSKGTTEVWQYGDFDSIVMLYLYFENGILTSYQIISE